GIPDVTVHRDDLELRADADLVEGDRHLLRHLDRPGVVVPGYLDPDRLTHGACLRDEATGPGHIGAGPLGAGIAREGAVRRVPLEARREDLAGRALGLRAAEQIDEARSVERVAQRLSDALVVER